MAGYGKKMEETKKISFGFSKISKKTIIKPKQEQEKVQFIDSVEEKAIIVKDAVEEPVNKPLIIPIKQSKNLQDRIKEAKEKQIKTEIKQEDERPDSELTLDELAARELLRDAKNRLSNEPIEEKDTKILPGIQHDANESTLEDYESIPISDFGKAMLRGMGWKDTDKSSMANEPELRPKGLGLGANKLIKSENVQNSKDQTGNELNLVKGAFAKIIAGNYKGNYCQVQGFDDEAGRIIVKTSLKQEILNLNEFLLVAVTKEEFTKNSKIINNAKYEEYIESGKIKKEEKTSSNSESERSRHRNRKDKSRYRDRSRSRSNYKRKKRIYRSSSSSGSSVEYKTKKNKCKSRHRKK